MLDERKILLRNLSGNSAFKGGAKHTTESLQPEPPNAAAQVAVDLSALVRTEGHMETAAVVPAHHDGSNVIHA